MLKTLQDGSLWMVTQIDHSAIAGFLAAHWGNAEFARPGYFGTAKDPERLRDETVFAIAQHDNGWWEWEAEPELSDDDGFPFGLGEALKNPHAGFERWRRGLKRFPQRPMVNVLISSHCNLFYASRTLEHPDPAFTHPLSWKRAPEQFPVGSIEAPRAFMHEVEAMQKQWTTQLQADSTTASWLERDNLAPLQRLIQLCDGLSLALCSALVPAKTETTRGLGEDAFELHNVPRTSWSDRVTITATPQGNRCIELDPYPFDIDPLPVVMPVRIVALPCERPVPFHSWWHAHEREFVSFQFVKRK